MSILNIDFALEKSIKSYCDLNDISDVERFANNCLLQGFNIVRFGISPKDNIVRETNGIKDISKNDKTSSKKEPPREDTRKQEIDGAEERRMLDARNEKKEETQLSEEKKENVTIRKIRIIKK